MAKSTTTPTQTTTTDFNITIQLGSNNQPVTLYAADLANVTTKGLHFSLPDGTVVKIGTLKELIGWLNEKLGTGTIPDSAGADWPEAIKDIFDGVLNVSTSVTQFNFDQDPKDADGNYPSPTFSLAVTGTAMDPNDPTITKPIPFGGIFSVVGGGVGVTRTNS